jgi:general secretion pathway protein D
VRDKKGVVESIEKLLATVDVDTPEVLLNIEILEVAKDSLLGLGVKIPDKIDMRVLNSLGSASNFTINDIKNFTSDSLRLLTTDPVASLNLKQTSSKSNLLANPRIRVKSKELASFLIGDKVPVITTTTGESTNFLSESVNYLDVGLKLEILPIVNKNNQIDVDIKLEVSNIVKEINSKNGLLAYQIGTRNTSTKLQLSNGETQMLAGLIKDDTNICITYLRYWTFPYFRKIIFEHIR